MVQKPTYEELVKRIQVLEQIELNHRQIEKDLQHQTETHKILMNISANCINVQLDKVGDAIQSALAEIGEFVSADRVYVFNYDFEKNIAINTYEWCNKGIEPQIENLQNSPLENAHDWVESHFKGEPLIIPDVSNLPSGALRDILEQQKIKSLIAVPLFHEDRLIGFTGFDSVKKFHAHSDREIELFKFFAQILINLKMCAQAGKAMRDSEYKLATHLQNTPIGALSWDLNFKTIEWNPAAEAIFGYSKKEAMGKHVTELILPEEMKESVDDIFRDLISEKGGARSTNENITKDGRRIICDWYNTTLKDAHGQIIGVASLVHDITERKQAFEAFKKQKEFTEKIIKTSSAMIVGLDKNHKIKIFNQGAEKITGFTNKEVIGGDWFKVFFKPDIYDEMDKVWKNAWGAKFNSYVNPILAKNGDEKIISWQTTGMYDDENETKHVMISIGEDITQRTQAEKALKESEEKYRTMMDAMKNAAYSCSPDFQITYTNPAMIDRVGRDIAGELCYKAIYGLDQKCSWCVFGRVQKGEHIDYEVADPKNNRYYSVSNSPIFHGDGTASKLTIFHDITEIKNIEAQLQQSRKRESIGTLTGGIAHDFNNILYMIVGNAELALEDIPKWNPAHANLEEIKSASLRAAGIVKQLLNFTRKTDQELKPISAVPIIKDALKFLRSTIPTTIEIQEHLPDDDIMILADPTQINQIMMNLCINASQSMEETGGILEVKVEKTTIEAGSVKAFPYLSKGEYIKITTSDTGPGIDPEIITRIFDPYFTTKEMGKGSGMGLSIVHGIVKNHDGAIFVDSKLGKGTTFTLLFPMIDIKPEVKIKTTGELPHGTETILFVDDEEVITDMMQKILEKLGYKVEARLYPEEALELFKAKPEYFDLVITDMTMPQMTGVNLSEKLMGIRSDIPVIICTGHSSLIDEGKAKQLGITGYVMKPVSMSKLAKTIRKVLDT